MATKKQAIEKVTKADTLDVLTESTNDLLGKYASILSQEALSPTLLARTLKAIRGIKEVLEDKRSGLETVAKQRMVAFIKGHGIPTSDKGALSVELGGLVCEMRPYRTGYDSKKVEALLRAKGKEPSHYMVQEIKYVLPDENTAGMEKVKKLLGDELESCRYEESWTLMTPK